MKAMKLWVVCCLLITPVAAWGQNLTATVTGATTDPTGGTIAGAHIRVVNRDTGVVAWDGVTNSSGLYVRAESAGRDL